MHRARRLWDRLLERESWPLYAYLGLIGILALAAGRGVTPESMRQVLPGPLVLAWTIALALGGVLTVVGYFTLRENVEQSGLVFMAFAAALYGTCITIAAWPYGATVLAISLAVFTSCAIRFRILRRARKAQEVATQIVRGER